MAGRSTTSSRPGGASPSNRVNPALPKLLGHDNKGKVLCLADIRGRISSINELAQEVGASAILHTGDFGFFENSSLDRINDRTLRHLILYSPLVSSAQREQLLAEGTSISSLRSSIASSPTPLLSEFPKLLSGEIKLSVPVYTVWGACEDVTVLEKFRSGEYEIDNLHILDEATTRCLDIGGVKLRLLGLGGALVPHKMFDNGDGHATIAGGQGTMWTTALQIGELVDTAQRTYDQSETRLLVTHASPGREGLIAQLALVLKADLTISAGLHFRYASSYNEFSVQNDMDGFRQKLIGGKENFGKVWDNVKAQVEAVIDENQRILLEKCLSVVERVPPAAQAGNSSEEPAWKNCWNWNLCDAAYGYLVLDIKEGRVSSELKSQGFNYAYRRKSETAADSTSSGPLSNLTSSGLAGTATLAAHPIKPSTVQKEADSAPKVNGTSVASTTPGSPIIGSDKPTKKKPNKKEKEREREKREESARSTLGPFEEAERANTPLSTAASKPLPRSNAPSPAPSTSASRLAHDPELLSPTNETDSTGGRTPVTNRPRRNPNTLFMSHIPVPVSEEEIREFFGPAKDGITSVKLPVNHYNRQQKPIAFVEFGDKEAMEEGLAKHLEKLKDIVPKVNIAEDRSGGDVDGGGRGGRPFRGAGRGGRGGYVARNGVVAAAQAAAGGRVTPVGDGGKGKKGEGKKD